MTKYQIGNKHSEETKRKMRLSHLGIKHSEVSKKKMSSTKKGIKTGPMSEIAKRNMKIERQKRIRNGWKPWNKGIKLSNKIKQNMSNAQKGKEHKKGKLSHNWKGGRGYCNGYVRLNINGKIIYEHILVWLKANQLHRLPDDCVVHHCNLIKDDNRIENLQLMDNSSHIKLHRTMEGKNV